MRRGNGDARSSSSGADMNHHHHLGLGVIGGGRGVGGGPGKGCATPQCSWRLLAIALLLTCGLLAAALAYFTGKSIMKRDYKFRPSSFNLLSMSMNRHSELNRSVDDVGPQLHPNRGRPSHFAQRGQRQQQQNARQRYVEYFVGSMLLSSSSDYLTLLLFYPLQNPHRLEQLPVLSRALAILVGVRADLAGHLDRSNRYLL